MRITTLYFFLPNIVEQAMTCVLMHYRGSISINYLSMNLVVFCEQLHTLDVKCPKNTVLIVSFSIHITQCYNLHLIHITICNSFTTVFDCRVNITARSSIQDSLKAFCNILTTSYHFSTAL